MLTLEVNVKQNGHSSLVLVLASNTQFTSNSPLLSDLIDSSVVCLMCEMAIANALEWPF